MNYTYSDNTSGGESGESLSSRLKKLLEEARQAAKKMGVDPKDAMRFAEESAPLWKAWFRATIELAENNAKAHSLLGGREASADDVILELYSLLMSWSQPNSVKGGALYTMLATILEEYGYTVRSPRGSTHDPAKDARKSGGKEE